MSTRTHALPLGVGLSAAICMATPATADEAATRPAARVYTNEDLERVRPYRDETGVASVPAALPEGDDRPGRRRSRATAPDDPERPRGRGEEYWRHEATKVRDRLRRLADQAEGVRGQITREQAQHDAKQRTFGGQGRRGSTTTSIEFDRVPMLRARLEAIERRARLLEEEFSDRARREGALPGWLR